MAKSNYLTTIAIDSARSAFHFYSMIGDDKGTIAHHIKSYAGGRFDDEFFKKFKDAVEGFAADTPSESVRKVTVVLPDNAVLTDTVRIPTMKGFGQTKKTLDITLGGLYSNYNQLQFISHVAEQNKQYSTFVVAAVQKHVISSIYAACAENKLLVDTLTYASSATVGGAVLLNPKLKNASYLFLDIKDVYAKFIFVAHGRVVGNYTLPFGLEFLRKPRVVQEDMLFDHSFAELTVLNAREKAKSKKLTVMSLDETLSATDAGSEEGNSFEEEIVARDEVVSFDDEEETVSAEGAEGGAEEVADGEGATAEEADLSRASNQKIFVKKAPRKLPKFMLRDIPNAKEEIAYENFRVFVKWALTLMQGNEKLTELGKPEFVCVNLPSDLSHVLDMANWEAEENGISFTRLSGADDDAAISANLELYGGFFPKQIGATGKF